MKSTQTELLTFLKGLGVDAEIVESQEESEFNNDTALTAIDTNRRKILQPLIEEEVLDTKIAQFKAAAGGSLRSALVRKTGVSRKDLDAFKTDDEVIDAAINYKLGLLDGEKAEFKKQLDAILDTHKSDVESMKVEYETKLSEANQKFTNRNIKEYVESQLQDAPLPKGANKSVIAEDLTNALMAKYHLSYNEAAKKVELFTKDNPNMPALNPSKNDNIKISDEAKDFLSPRGLWMEDMRDVNAAEEMNGRTNNNIPGKQNSPISLNANPADKKESFLKKLSADLKTQQV